MTPRLAHLVIATCTLPLLAALALGCAPEGPHDHPDVDVGPARVRLLVNAAPHDPGSQEQEVDEARYGDPIHVVVEGVAAGRPIVVQASGAAGTSRARFVAPAGDDTIDLDRDAPVDDPANTWQGADGEAWLSTMQDPPPSTGSLDLAVTVRALDADSGEELASATLQRRYIDDGLVLEPVDDGTAQGLLALPAGEGPFPAVLVFGGSEGGTGTGEFQAMYLASLGYAALGVGYFGAPGLPAELKQVPIEILEDDLLRLASDPRVDPARIAVMGASRGGELALLLGATFGDRIAAVVAGVPSGYVWSSVDGSAAAWTIDGAPVPFVPSSGGAFADVEYDDDGVPHYTSRGMFLDDIAAADPAALDAATIRAEDIVGAVLFLAGEDDALWPSCPMADVAVARRARSDDDEVHCFAGAGHASVGVPGWSSAGSDESFFDDVGGYLVLGGDAQHNGRAVRDGDTALRGFLSRL